MAWERRHVKLIGPSATPTGQYHSAELLRPPHGRQQRGMIQSALVALTVDKECRRPRNAAAHASHEVPLDPRPVTARLYIGGVLLEIELEFHRELMQQIGAQFGLLLKDGIVHLPESPLSSGGLRCFRRVLRIRMH